MDPLEAFKENAKKSWWGSFTRMEMVTGTAAPRLVRFAGISPGARVLDVACGTGVVALTAARTGAKVTGLDLTAALIEHAREDASLMGLGVDFVEGDVEKMPFPDASFDVVVSQFGHIFAPRPERAVAEMLRVLVPGGTIAFSTWPPELYIGRFFALMSRYAPTPPPPDMPLPHLWGDPNVVRERLGDAVRDLAFDRATMFVQVLSPQHARVESEQRPGPMSILVQALRETDPEKLAAFRRELEALLSVYFEDNQLRQDYLLSRAIKR